MTPTPPTPPPARTAQPPITALRLAIEDEARTLRFHLQHGARWLLQDFQSGVGMLEQMGAPGARQLPKLQHFVESAAQATGLVLESAENAAALAASSDAPYRKLHFQLLPLASYFRNADNHDPSRLFTSVFYWLIRHALETRSTSGLMVRQRLINEAYWTVLARNPAMVARLNTSPSGHDATDSEQNLRLCVLLFESLLQTRPVYDGNMPPWTQSEIQGQNRASAFASLLSVVVALGLSAQADVGSTGAGASDLLSLANQLVGARLCAFEDAASRTNARDALADELSFVFRHA